MAVLATLALFLAPLTCPVVPSAPSAPYPRGSVCGAASEYRSPGSDEEYRARAQRWLDRHQHPSDPDETLVQLVDRAFAHLDLGLFDVRMETHFLADREWLGELQSVSIALLNLQAEWSDWLPGHEREDISRSDVEDSIKTITKWIGRWKLKHFEAGSADLFEATGAKPAVRMAVTTLADYMRGGGALSTRESPYEPVQLVLIPDREDFVEFSSVAALAQEWHRPYFWVPGPEIWTEFEFDGSRAISFQHALPNPEEGYRGSMSMNKHCKTGVQQHVVQLAAQSMLSRLFGERLDSVVAAGISNDMVISLYGEVDTRTDGDLRARSTEARSMFVPGGNPDGGVLPPLDASGRWRTNRGKGYFVDVLRRSQKAAAKQADERWKKNASFLLQDEDGSGKRVFSAPFLGAGVTDFPTESFRGDYADFVRAYRAAFLHWLRESGAVSKKDSAKHYAALLRGLANGDDSLLGMIEKIYGMPLSGDSGDSTFGGKSNKALEPRFLKWLSKQH